jgi:hypothetical protein
LPTLFCETQLVSQGNLDQPSILLRFARSPFYLNPTSSASTFSFFFAFLFSRRENFQKREAQLL